MEFKKPNLLQSPVILPIPYTPPTLGSGPCAFLSHTNPYDWGVLQDWRLLGHFPYSPRIHTAPCLM